jgi:hypothetical protein
LWAVVVAVVMMASALSGANQSEGAITGPLARTETARAPRLLRPNSYAQYRWIASPAPVKVWSSRVRRGKSWGACMDAVRRCLAVPGYPAALTRLEFASMRESILQTLQRMLGVELYAELWSESKHTLFFPPVRCDDGIKRQSRIVCFGWLDPGRALSTEYGLIVMEQAEQMEREHMAFAQTRLNFYDEWQERRCAEVGIMPRQLGIICNADDPEHWINQDFRIEESGMREAPELEVILSSERDNEENLTDDYRLRLESLRGTVWYDRLVGGRWARAEGLVYGNSFDPSFNIIERPAEWAAWGGFPPPNQPRHRAMDFGVNHPFVCHWAAEQPDGKLIVYRELYGTGRAPSEWAEAILAEEAREVAAWNAAVTPEGAHGLEPYLMGYSCETSTSDHEKGWRLELDRCGVWTAPAEKDIKGMVGAMTAMLRERRLLYVRDMLVEADERLVNEKLPTSVLQEYGRYKWPKRRTTGQTSDERFDVPVDRDNHGLDADGYMVIAHLHSRRAAVS